MRQDIFVPAFLLSGWHSRIATYLFRFSLLFAFFDTNGSGALCLLFLPGFSGMKSFEPCLRGAAFGCFGLRFCTGLDVEQYGNYANVFNFFCCDWDVCLVGFFDLVACDLVLLRRCALSDLFGRIGPLFVVVLLSLLAMARCMCVCIRFGEVC